MREKERKREREKERKREREKERKREREKERKREREKEPREAPFRECSSNISLGWKSLSVANISAYWGHPFIS